MPPSPPDRHVEGRVCSTVQVGDSLQLGISREELCRWNGLHIPLRRRLMPGDEWMVVAGAGPATPFPRIGVSATCCHFIMDPPSGVR
jgi:hypothetical protein